MLYKSFGDYVDKKKRDTISQLNIIEQILKKGGLRVEAFLKENTENDPYVFCFNPRKNGSFDGVRIYKIGNSLAFRVQQESETHPYGKAYPLDVEEMFQDFLSDDGVTQRKAAENVISSIAKELRLFFEKSEDAERDSRKSDKFMDKDDARGNVSTTTTGTDYANMIN